MAFRSGRLVKDVPGVRGVWSVWSQGDAYPGAYHLVPADEEARAAGRSFVTVRLREDGAKLVADVPKSHAQAV